ncbi:hypothetical protein LCGC14_0342220 [marine sediment metagenome]|uniref:Uncharacterized protein n=1 Tax=marine sediment metagenome TaxID=412755 RepID=A0A0F9TD58_9ZZZZ
MEVIAIKEKIKSEVHKRILGSCHVPILSLKMAGEVRRELRGLDPAIMIAIKRKLRS